MIILGRTDLTFPYVPSHLSYMLLELLKNSMRATVETHGTDNMPPIKIVIADGEENEDVRYYKQLFCLIIRYYLLLPDKTNLYKIRVKICDVLYVLRLTCNSSFTL